MATYTEIEGRLELSTGEILIIQRIRHKYCCYVVPIEVGASPEYLIIESNLEKCRKVFADRLAEDVCDVF